MTGEAISIEVRGLDAYWGDRKVLAGIDLAVRQGEIMVIMGGSGSGKSTLLNHLLGLLHPAAGSVRLLGRDLSALSSQEILDLRRHMGVAFQGGALFSSLTVAENIMLPLEEHTRLDRKTMEIIVRLKLEVVNLAGFGHLMPSELSGGMTKRAALARAIVLDPRLLFCDEPSAGLDPVVSSAIDDLILRLRDAMGMTIVVVTHDLDSAFKIADRICVLDEGTIVALGTRAEIRASPVARVQNLLNRRTEEATLDTDAYLRRLLGES
ncbi:MAG: ATP-binding cassette domain-containing protein [Telmatospirillum sp.]|nr:ATP-binding cassette domain-containing protein [Telmatospirillum sp.]